MHAVHSDGFEQASDTGRNRVYYSESALGYRVSTATSFLFFFFLIVLTKVGFDIVLYLATTASVRGRRLHLILGERTMWYRHKVSVLLLTLVHVKNHAFMGLKINRC